MEDESHCCQRGTDPDKGQRYGTGTMRQVLELQACDHEGANGRRGGDKPLSRVPHPGLGTLKLPEMAGRRGANVWISWFLCGFRERPGNPLTASVGSHHPHS